VAGTLLVRGMLIGILAGLLCFSFLKIVGEPQGDGPMIGRCLVGPAPTRVPYPLPKINDDDRLTPSVVGSMERTLGIQTGFPSI
jgi:hypothetical protein